MRQLSIHVSDKDIYFIEIIIFVVIFSNILLSKPHYFVIVLRCIGEKARINNIKQGLASGIEFQYPKQYITLGQM